ncbi:ADP-ribosylglycohydrolase family protein [Deinococcus sp.]|uniref:ADP-ribosylglycohydrolase family protein n=1 Tax=Deinococcus sp. TaxID=47478 RepID=UPI0025BD9DA3|nr:ADP-ribosylglycohydrolase family protein [Deinococcus sp.]
MSDPVALSDLQRVRGMFLEAAYGDALAAPVEFTRDVAAIRRAYPPAGPGDIHQGRVTDDTQMMLAVGRALAQTVVLRGEQPSLRELLPELEAALRAEFTEWLHDPENNRAPGMTCLQACRALEQKQPWYAATVRGSKGCGANMRVQPAALIRSQPLRSFVAQFQAAVTHGHPTALAASDLTAQSLRLLLDGTPPAQLLPELSRYMAARRQDQSLWLEPLVAQSPATTSQQYLQRGWDECQAVLDLARAAAERGIGEHADPCEFTGEGWVAEEALATGLLCFLLHPADPVRALQCAATTSGDSDSIACITGSLLGAHLGAGAFPGAWESRIEYHRELEDLARTLAPRFGAEEN